MYYLILLAFFTLVGQNTAVAQTPPEEDYSALLCSSLHEAEKASNLSATERYEDKFNDFSKALTAGETPYRMILKRGPEGVEFAMAYLFEDYRAAQEFWRAYMNDRAFVKRQDRTMEPTYLIERAPWPPRLEDRFPGLIAAIREKGDNGYYISGDKALKFIFMRLSRRLKAMECRGEVNDLSILRRSALCNERNSEGCCSRIYAQGKSG